MKNIETKTAKNGAKLYYLGGKRVSREIALETAGDNREGNLFTVEYDAVVKGNVETATVSVDKIDLLVRQEAGRYNIYFRIIVNGKVVCSTSGHKDYADEIKAAKAKAGNIANKIAEAYINGAQKIKVFAGEVTIVAEAGIEDYAVSTDAQDAAIEAEIEIANNNNVETTTKEETQMTIETNININSKTAKFAAQKIISITQYNTFCSWAEKISNGQRDSVTQIKTHLNKWLGYSLVLEDEILHYIDTDDMNGFRTYLAQFPFVVKDDAGYFHKLYVHYLDDNSINCTLAEIHSDEEAILNAVIRGETEQATEAEEKLTEVNELNGISEEMYKKMASVKWLAYTVGTNGKVYWFEFGRHTTQKRAQEILAEYGLTIEEYIGNLQAYEDEHLRRTIKSLYIKRKIWYDRQPLNDDDVFRLLPEVSELNDVDENEIEQASEPAILSHEDETPADVTHYVTYGADADYLTPEELQEIYGELEEITLDLKGASFRVSRDKGICATVPILKGSAAHDSLYKVFNDYGLNYRTFCFSKPDNNPPANNNPPAPEIPPTVQAATEKLAEINSTAPDGLEIIYDAETKKFPVVSYNDKFPKIFYELDSLALYNALPIEKFWKRIERGCYTDEEEIEWLEDSIARARGMREDFAADENPDLDLLNWLDFEIADREGELAALKAKMSNIG